MATTTKENLKGIKAIQERLIQGKKEIKKADLEELGFDTSVKKFEIGNIKFEKDLFFDTFYFSITDKQKDLDGNPINENTKLLHRIHTLYEAGKREFPFSELHILNILPLPSEIKIGNILLSNYLGIDKSYDITLIAKEKNIDNKWLDSSVTITRVLDTLINFQYDKKMLELAEVPLNKELEKYFKEHFESVKKSDTSNKGLIDLTISNEKNKVAIELKLSRKLKQANESQKCRGQIEDYHKQFGKNLILVVAGLKSEMDDKYVSAATDKATSLGIKFYRMFPHEKT
jgi:hypothetical protein